MQTVVQIHRSGSGCGTSFFNFSLSGSKGTVSMPLPELADAHLSSPDLGNARPRNHSLPSAGSGRQEPGEQKAIFLPKLPFSTSFSPDSSKSTGLKREFAYKYFCVLLHPLDRAVKLNYTDYTTGTTETKNHHHLSPVVCYVCSLAQANSECRQSSKPQHTVQN